MLDAVIKYFSIILLSFFTFKKILNKQFNKNKYIIVFGSIACSLLISIITCVLRKYFPYLSLFSMIVLSILFLSFVSKTKIELSISTTIISFGINYTFYIIISVLISTILSLTNLKELTYTLSIVIYLISSILQAVLVFLIFKIKRLENGMPFLISKGSSDLGVAVSSILLCAAIILTNNKAQLLYVIPLILIFMCAVFIMLWWRKRMTQTYIERLKAKELENLHNAIQEKENRINYLEQQNEILSKIIHKDNKLIPAMELSVKNFLSNPEVNKENGEKFLKELSEISQERYGIIEKYKNSEKKLPLTNVFLIDTTFNFMLNKATQNNIDFDLDLSGSVQYMTDNIINEKDLNTLLADLIENAIIATKLSEIKKIIVNIGVLDNNYFIDIIDSGIPFKEETFNKLGMEKATTHKGEGGSGIGMLSTFEFLRKTNASFVIKEFNDDKLKFTKKLSIIFNNEHQFIVDSYRAQELKKTCIRNDIIFCNN